MSCIGRKKKKKVFKKKHMECTPVSTIDLKLVKRISALKAEIFDAINRPVFCLTWNFKEPIQRLGGLLKLQYIQGPYTNVEDRTRICRTILRLNQNKKNREKSPIKKKKKKV